MGESYPRTGVAVIVPHNGCLLLGRSNKPNIAGKWVVPGGKIKPFESILDTGMREVLEETGIAIQVKHQLFVTEILNPPDEHRVIIYVLGQYIDGEPTPGDDLSEVRWVDTREFGDIQDEMTDATVDAVTKFSMYLNSGGRL